MVSSLILSPSILNPKSSFLQNPRLIFAPSCSAITQLNKRASCYKSPKANSLDHIPKKFRQQNLNDGLMDNYKNAPQYLYGLTPSQMDMFMTEDNPVRRQAEKVTEDSISSSNNYLNNGGMWSLSGAGDRGPSKYSMSVSMYRGGGRGAGRPRTAPPDLPSLLLDARIVYLGMPIVPAVTELVIAQFMWLDFDNQTKPIYLYINSSGTQDDKMETVGSETEAYAIADTMSYCKSDVYTVNCGMAYGQAAMLLSVGTKGYRALQPNSSTKLYLPKVNKSSGAVIDMWIKAKELDANTDYYIELLAKGTGKPKEEIAKDIQRPKYLQAQDAIAYGVADKIIDSQDSAFERRNYDEILAQSRAMRKPPAGTQAASSGFR
ncbi:serine protease [Lithospermum erythrorhizon]|uniref:ATP-dependent Clp protease proteolytic subunit n=1 Tax=Lithospermum erythrorhizon TaxID=34254 RepID=A0AAV3PY30_LITER